MLAFLEAHACALRQQENGDWELLYAQQKPSSQVQIMLMQALHASIRLRESTPEQVQRELGYWQESEQALQAVEEEALEAQDDHHLRDLASEAPIIRYVNQMLKKAIQARTSDVHLEPSERDLRVRFRIDGVMQDIDHVPKRLQAAIISRIKIMANLDIGERRLPQDGRIRYPLDELTLDLRVSTLPTQNGESVVMRVLDRGDVQVGLQHLGMPAHLQEAFQRLVQHPNGILLVTGPTGSGKTTSLYAALQSINSVERKIITVEDPVEYQIEGINQIQVNAQVGLTFAAGLRSILRQDPDVIMVGEIRDRETAAIAVESALTGHMVLSTLHTNDAAGAVARLLEMEIDPFLLAATLRGVLAQRLLRRLCSACCTWSPMTPVQAQLLGWQDTLPEIAHAQGCEHCFGSGYHGRIGVYELLPVDTSLAGLISQQADTLQIKAHARQQGMQSLNQAALALVLEGKTSVEEALKIRTGE
ncbi:general secretion pathway protein E [Allopseudospirillum japonicum]|uniref:General secretion pathway protein E n=1 Tax=Allopseudospirillum japonicum TaxID=64971 RepID=A0A1H6SHF9_9GAMM|nr:GspE/PulE family protein [Allopseudospirillum japonicum]SEI67291.1 general secretion pathway protein E [Allopseudospirillum japonicum]